MVDYKKYMDESFKNPYLTSVAFEILYPSSIRILEKFSDFQDIVNEEYPNYGEEIPFLNIPDSMMPPKTFRKIKLHNKDNTAEISITHNAFALIVKDYTKFDLFAERAKNLTNKFIESFKIKKIIRIGLRYINQYPIATFNENSLVEIIDLFKPLYNLDLFESSKIIRQNIEIREEVEDSVVITKRTSLKAKTNQEYIFILDFDTYLEAENDIQDYVELLLKLRLIGKREFLKSITEKFLSKVNFIEKEEQI